MKVAIYHKVPSSERRKAPVSQDLQEFALAQDWEIYNQYQDYISLSGNSRRTGWIELMVDARQHKFELILIRRLDQIFRSATEAAKILKELKSAGTGLRSYSEPWFDTVSVSGGVLYHLTLFYAAREKNREHQNLKSGLAHARKMGCQIGRPRVTQRPHFNQAYGDILERLRAGQISRRQAARALGIGYATLKRLIDSKYQGLRDS